MIGGQNYEPLFCLIQPTHSQYLYGNNTGQVMPTTSSKEEVRSQEMDRGENLHRRCLVVSVFIVMSCGNGIGQKEELNCDTVLTKTSVSPRRSLELRWLHVESRELGL